MAKKDEALIAACSEGSRKKAESALEPSFFAKGADIETVDAEGRTPLLIAAERRCADVVDLLVLRGADTNAAGPKRRSPLHLAAEGGDIETAQVLAANDARIDARDESGRTPLMAALEGGHIDLADFLNERGAELPKGDFFFRLLAGKAVPALLWLAGRGGYARLVDARKRTPLFSAARWNELEFAAVLLRAGVNVNALDEDGETALFPAAVAGYAEMVALLCENKADPNLGASGGNTLIAAALLAGQGRIVELLLRYGADVDAQVIAPQATKVPLLRMALERGAIELAKKLVLAGAALPDGARGGSASFLAEAVASGDGDFVRFLLDHGAAADEDDWAPLRSALDSGNLGVAELLAGRAPPLPEALSARYALLRAGTVVRSRSGRFRT